MNNETKMSADVAMSVLRAHAEVARVSDEHGLHADMIGCAEAVAALIARNAELEANNKALRAAYHKARNAAAGFSNYCEESANSRRCERELAEAERMFRDIDAARAEAGHG